MSFPRDDIDRVKELYAGGMAPYAISNYMDNISRNTINKVVGKKRGNVVTTEDLSTRQRQKYINQIPVPQ